jgi:hypothetical protein
MIKVEVIVSFPNETARIEREKAKNMPKKVVVKKKATTLEFDPDKGPMNEQISDILDECFINNQKKDAFREIVANLFKGKEARASSTQGKQEAHR